MGLAASQARLLTITSRMHDVEFEAQDLMQKKINLATDKDALYQEYCKALDAKKIQVAYTGSAGTLNYVDATFTSVCGYNSKRPDTYALTDARTGCMVVEDDVYAAYQNFAGRDKYAFAFEMLGFETDDCCNDKYGVNSYDSTVIGINTDGFYDKNVVEKGYSGQITDSKTGETISWLLMSDVEAAAYEKHETELSDAMSKFKEALAKNDKDELQTGIEAFRKALYGNNACAQDIFDGLAESSPFEASEFGNFDKGEFDYYVKLFEGIEAAGGCVSVSEFSPEGSTDNDWFNNVIQSGKLILNQYMTGAQKGWKEISAATCTTIQEVKDDVAIKKAEAKYNYELSKVNNKEKKYDQSLNKLETERTALKTEMDSIKKVKDENIERTFGIFS